jgi:hypothetical protein
MSAALLLFKMDIPSRTEKRTIHLLQNRTILFALDSIKNNRKNLFRQLFTTHLLKGGVLRP